MARRDVAVQMPLLELGDTAPAAVARHRLPTNLTSRKHPVHRWCNFIAGFSPEFVQACLDEADLTKGATLLDPFAGMATALVAANARGYPAVGYEPHPFFADIARAKIATRSPELVTHAARLLSSVTRADESWDRDWSEPARTFLAKLVPAGSLERLGTARHRLADCVPEAQPVFRLMLSRMLEMAAGSLTDGIYKAPTTRKRSLDYDTSLELVHRQLMEDLASEPMDTWADSVLHVTSSESMTELADDSTDICVTSPPYLNNFDFAEMARMELYFWGYAGSWGEITQRVRSRLIINTTTAPTQLRRKQAEWASELPESFIAAVDEVRNALAEQKRLRAGKKEYDTLVYPYFAQMQRVLREAYRVLRPDSRLHLVVADAALYGVHIHTESLLAHILAQVGFEIKEISRLRTRGDRWVLDKRDGSAEPLGEFHIHATTPGKTTPGKDDARKRRQPEKPEQER